MLEIPGHAKLLSARWLIPLVIATFSAPAAVPAAQTAAGKLKLETGKQIYDGGCVSCHGPDGKRQSQNLAGLERPSTFADFSYCLTATPEPDVQQRATHPHGRPG